MSIFFQSDSNSDFLGNGYNMRSALINNNTVSIQTDITWQQQYKIKNILLRDTNTDIWYGARFEFGYNGKENFGFWSNVNPFASTAAKQNGLKHKAILAKDNNQPTQYFNEFKLTKQSVKLGNVYAHKGYHGGIEVDIDGLAKLLDTSDFEVVISPDCFNDVIVLHTTKFVEPPQGQPKEAPEPGLALGLICIACLCAIAKKLSK